NKNSKSSLSLSLSLVHSYFPSKKHQNTLCNIFIYLHLGTNPYAMLCTFIDSHLSLTILIFRAHTSRFLTPYIHSQQKGPPSFKTITLLPFPSSSNLYFFFLSVSSDTLFQSHPKEADFVSYFTGF
ncbi:hypothetical protein V8G54_037363, partial [Vigna mungo]